MEKKGKRILVVEDEPHLAFNLRINLEREGYDVVHADDGIKAVERFKDAGPFAAIILDVMLPEKDGFAVAQEIRKLSDKIGILMLTARAAEEDRIKGFEFGVDDYLTKPFPLRELLLRVKRMVTRSKLLDSEAPANLSENEICLGPFRLNVEDLVLTTPSGQRVLTALEADILKAFMNNPNRILSRSYLLEQVWGVNKDVETRTVDNFVARLRRYIEEDPSQPKYLESVRGRGYRLKG